jgi:two-component system response regulator DegU
MPSDQARLSVFTFAGSRLAREYLLQILSVDASIDTNLHEVSPTPQLGRGPIVFVLDRDFAFPPVEECVLQLHSRFSDARFIVIDSPPNTDEVVRLVKLGVHGFVEYSVVADTLCNAVHAVAKGDLWIRSDILQAYVRLTARPMGQGRDVLSVTRRELEVLALLRARLSNKEIANTLRIRESTVKYHVSNLFEKLQVANRHELIRERKFPLLWDELKDTAQILRQSGIAS